MSIEAVIFDFSGTIYNPATERLYPETIHTLEELLRKDIRLGLATIARSPERRAAQILTLGLIEYFEPPTIDIVPLDQPKNFAQVLRALGVANQLHRAIVVGDNLTNDIAPANKLGAYTVLIRQRPHFGRPPQDQLHTPNATITAIEELIPLVDHLNADPH